MSMFKKKGVLLLCALSIGFAITGCRKEAQEPNGGMDTGAWNGGTMTHNGIKIHINGPEVGHPSGDTLWSTYYEDEEKALDVNVDFFAVEASLEEKLQDLEAVSIVPEEGVLWGNDCFWYVDETQTDEVLIVLISLDEENYLRVDVKGGYDPLTDGEALFADEAFQQAFELEIE